MNTTKIRLFAMVMSLSCALPVFCAPLTYQQGPVDNPLKGWVADSWAGSSTRPHSLEHVYIAFADLMTGPSTFNWTALDNQLSTTNGRGNQLIVRVYLDYPKYASVSRNRGLPQWLLDAGVAVHSYDGGASLSPDYENPTLRSAMKNFIAAFGARYDGHAGIGAVELGLLGMWGEWHVYVNTSWEPSTTVQDEVFAAYRAAFTKTRLMVSGDAAPRQVGAIGYHHDSYCYYTLGPTTWYFVPEMTAAGNQNNWKTQMIGGEHNPAVMYDVFKSPIPTTNDTQDPEACRTATHVSWMRNYALFQNTTITGGDYDRAIAQGRAMGYDFYVSSADMSLISGGSFTTNIKLENRGIAPFYYDWKLQLRLVNSSGSTVATYDTSWKLTGLLPGDAARSLTHVVNGHGLTSGSYKILMRAVNPLSNGKPLRFANTTQNADQNGWLTLGSVTISSATNLVSNPGFEANTATQTPSGWSEWSNKAGVGSGYTEAGGNTGSYRGAHWNSVAYNMYTYQTKTGLANGLYTLRARAKRGGGQITCQLEAKDYGGSTRAVSLPISSTFQLVELKDINVTNGQCTIGIWSDANAGNWAHFDDVQFLKQ